MSVNPAREAAVKELDALFRSERYANLSLDAAVKKYELSPRDKTLFTRLFFGVIERKITIDYLLSRFSDVPVNRIDPAVLVLLELGLYQILYLDRVPDRAAVDECVTLAKQYKEQSARFVNAVLRRAVREKENVPALLDLPGNKGLSLRESYPRYLVSLWTEQYGKERAEEICRAQNAPAAITLRVNTLKGSAADYGERLREAGIPFHPAVLCDTGITLDASLSPTELPGWDEGAVFVQDASAQAAARRLEAKPGETVLDLCAAPGGKSFSLAMDMENTGTLLALDLHPHRVKLIEEGAGRLGITCLKAAVGNAALPLVAWEGKADKVLCDVPCSGYGVIAKKPDIRLKKKEDGAELPALQGAILAAGSRALKTGGRLVYATCTLNMRENEDVTNAFLETHPAFVRKGEPTTIFPAAGENDGFFIDVLEKTHE